MAVHKLILHTADPHWVPDDAGELRRVLREIGLIGAEFSCAGRTHYCAGENFLHLLSFLGCSPSVALEPPLDQEAPDDAAKAFCHVHLGVPQSRVQFLSDPGTVPRCPRCRQRIEQWRDVITTWQQAPEDYSWQCPGCGHEMCPRQLDWRQGAGFGRLFIEIWGIHPHEAVPGDRLLAALRRVSGGEWCFFYARV